MSCECSILSSFISPVTGRILCDPENYILVGDKGGIATPSPALIDLRLDFIQLRKRYNTLVEGDIVIGHPNIELPHAQVLVDLPVSTPGIISQHNGLVSTTTLTENYFWIGDSNNYPVETNIFPIGALPDLPYQNIWIGDITNRPVPNQRIGLINLPPLISPLLINPISLPPGATVNFGLNNIYIGDKALDITEPIQPSTTLRVDMSNLPNLRVGKIWIGVKNPIPPIITIDDIPPFVHVEGDLNWDIRSSLPPLPLFDPDNYAVPKEVGLDPGTIFFGSQNPLEEGQIIQRGLDPGRIFIGSSVPGQEGQIVSTGLLPGRIFYGSKNPGQENRAIQIGLNPGRIWVGSTTPGEQGQMVEAGLNPGRMFIGSHFVGEEGQIRSVGLDPRRIFIGSDVIGEEGQVIQTGLAPGLMFIGSDEIGEENQIVPVGLPPRRMFMGSDDPARLNQIVTVSLNPGEIFMGSKDPARVGQIDEVGLQVGRMFWGDPNNPGQITTVTLNPGNIFIGKPDGTGITIGGLDAGQIYIGKDDNSGQMIEQGLPAKKIFIGNADNSGRIVVGGLSTGKTFLGGAEGELEEQGLDAGHIFIGSADNSGQIVTTGLAKGKTFIGNPDNSGEILPTGLSFNKIWMGDATNLIVEKALLPGQIFIGDRVNFDQITTIGLPAGQVFIGDSRIGYENEITVTGVDAQGLPAKYLFTGNMDNSGALVTTLKLDIDNLPDLQEDYFWRGNALNRPEAVQINLAPDDATYVIRLPEADLPNAHVTSEVGVGITKLVANGFFQIATPDEDYTTPEELNNQVQQLQNEIDNLQTELDNLETELNNLATRVTTAESNITTLQGQVATLQSEVATLQGQIVAIQGEIATLTGTVAGLSAAVAGISATLYTPPLGLTIVVPALAATVAALTLDLSALQITVDAPVTGLVARMNSITGGALSSILPPKFIIQTPDSIVPNAQALSLLSSGILKSTTGTGIVSIAIPDVDYTAYDTFSDYTFYVNDILVGIATEINAISLSNMPTVPTGDINANFQRIVDLADGIYPLNAVNKGQLDAAVAGLGTVSSVAATGSTGLTVGGSPITTSGTLTFTLDADLQALSQLSGTGLVTRTAANTYAERVLESGTGITVTNGSGVSGNPSISISDTSVSPGTYNWGNFSFTVNQQGQLTTASSSSTFDPSYITGFPSSSTKFLNGSGAWSVAFSSIVNVDVGVTLGTGITEGSLRLFVDDDLQKLSQISTFGIVARKNTFVGTSYEGITLEGTANQITVTNGDASSGNPVIAITDNTILPGTAGTKLAAGTTAQRSSRTGDIRFNTDSALYEFTPNGASWYTIINSNTTITLIGDVTGSGTASSISTNLSNNITRTTGQTFSYITLASSNITHRISNTNVTSLYLELTQIVNTQGLSIASGYRFTYTRRTGTIGIDYTPDTLSFSRISSPSTNNAIWSVTESDNFIVNRRLGVGRDVGIVGGAKLELYGTSGSITDGPHFQAVTNSDNFPVLQNLNWGHDNISYNFDCYYDGSNFRSSHNGSNFSIYKINNRLRFRYAGGITQGNIIPLLADSFSVDSSGVFYANKRPRGSSYLRNGIAASALTTSFSKLNMTMIANDNVATVVSNNYFQVLEAGYYTIQATISFTIASSATRSLTFCLYKNGSTQVIPSESVVSTNTLNYTYQVNILAKSVLLSVNDFVEIWANINTATNITVTFANMAIDF